MSLMPPSSQVTTEEMCLSAAAGDLDALAELYERYSAPVFKYLALRTHDQYLAEDLSSTTWERVATSIAGFRPHGGGFEAWLFTIARRCLAEHFRRTGRRKEYLEGEMLAYDQPSGSETPQQLLERKFDARKIAAEVEALPPAQRRCVKLRFFTGLSLAETAALMGKKQNAIKQLQCRAIRLLEKRLREVHGPDEATAATVVATDYSKPRVSAGGTI